MSDKMISVQDEMVKKINEALDEFAKPVEQGRADNDYPWIVFSLDDTEYAINVRYVLRVAVLYQIVPYTDAPPYCPGAIWDRSGIIRLFDLRVLLGQGDFLSAIKKEKSRLPMIIIIEPDGKRRGMIVDKIIVLEYVKALVEASVNEDCIQSRYVIGSIKYDPKKGPALVISPESFSTLKFEDSNTKIDWKGQIDIDMERGADDL